MLGNALAIEGRWPTESIARAKYRLASIYEHMGCNTAESRNLAIEAEKIRQELDPLANRHGANASSPKWMVDMAAYDHLVSFEAGRSTIGILRSNTIPLDITQDLTGLSG